jgi:glucose-6-phosphate dehydrogenase assembly protein OpcA
MSVNMEVSVAEIEKKLSELWKQMSQGQQSEQTAVLRACVLNLTVYAPGERAEDEVSRIMAEVSTQHPSRITIMLPNRDTESPVEFWVNALCHLAPGGRKHVCCEQIMLRAGRSGIDQLPGLVRSLQVSDLPAVLWWRGNLESNDPLFSSILDISDRIVLDSATFPTPETSFKDLAQMIQSEMEWISFTDLNWARLTPWRSAIAAFFDIPEYRVYLDKIERIEIECERASDSDGIPAQAFLIAGWLASRLKWKLKSKPLRAGQDRYSMELQSEKGNISIRIHLRQTGKKTPGISRICLYEEDHPTADFAVTRSEEHRLLKTNVELSGKVHAGRVLCMDTGDELSLISRELEIQSHDIVYEQAVSFLASLT